MDMMTTHPRERSLVGLVSDLWRDSATLIRDEAELAKAEIAEKVTDLSTRISALATGAAVLFAGFLLLLSAAVGLLALALPEEHAAWLSPLIIGGIVLAVGYALLAAARNQLKSRSFKPTQSARSVRKDMDVIKEHAS